MKVYILEHVVQYEGSMVLSVHASQEGAQNAAAAMYDLAGWHTMDERDSIVSDMVGYTQQYVEVTGHEVIP